MREMPAPDTFAEAVYQQRPKVMKAINVAVKECVLMAEHESDIDDFVVVFRDQLQTKFLEHMMKAAEEGPQGIKFNRSRGKTKMQTN